MIALANPKTATTEPNNHSLQTHRNRRPQGQESLGNRHGPVKATPHERDHDVHVRKQSTDLQYHDGIYVVQGAYSGID